MLCQIFSPEEFYCLTQWLTPPLECVCEDVTYFKLHFLDEQVQFRAGKPFELKCDVYFKNKQNESEHKFTDNSGHSEERKKIWLH